MKPAYRLLLLLLFTALILGTSVTSRSAVHAQSIQGIIAFVGTDSQGNYDIYLLDLSSGRTGRLDAPVNAGADLDWQPSGSALAFTTEDGGYGLLRGFRGCFNTDEAVCLETTYVIPAFTIHQLEWASDGSSLVFVTDNTLMTAPPRIAHSGSILDLETQCDRGISISDAPSYLLCAAADDENNTRLSVYTATDAGLSLAYEIGVYPEITVFDIGPQGQAVVGTLETGGDSGFFTTEEGVSHRLANFQIHVYDAEFAPDGSQIAIVGATSDSTGDGTLRDGDLAEIFLYNTATGELTQAAGFTEATALTWDPDGHVLFTLTSNYSPVLYEVDSGAKTPVMIAASADLQMFSPTWLHAAPGTTLPGISTATPFTTVASPVPSPTPFPTVAIPPTFTPAPTLTPWPSATPGSPMGSGCQFAHPLSPVNLGEMAEVTQAGAGLRLRGTAALTGVQLREMRAGTRMLILNGPTCSQGYRWWQVRIESDGQVGWVADSEQTNYWIQRTALVSTFTPMPTILFTFTPGPSATPTYPAESMLFLADRYSITAGECVTISWQVQGIKEVYYQGAGVIGKDSRNECPTATTTYSLRVVRMDNSEIEQLITIFVTSSP